MDDLYNTINSKTGIIPRRKLSNRGKMINKNSSAADMQIWFNEKDFSKRFILVIKRYIMSQILVG